MKSAPSVKAVLLMMALAIVSGCDDPCERAREVKDHLQTTQRMNYALIAEVIDGKTYCDFVKYIESRLKKDGLDTHDFARSKLKHGPDFKLVTSYAANILVLRNRMITWCREYIVGQDAQKLVNRAITIDYTYFAGVSGAHGLLLRDRKRMMQLSCGVDRSGD